MKKIFIVFSCLLIMISSIGSSYAAYVDEDGYLVLDDEDIQPSYFMGNEVPLLFDGISLYANVDGYTTYDIYKDDNGNDVYFTDSVTLPNTNNRCFILRIEVPEVISKGSLFDVTLKIAHNDLSSITYDHVRSYDSNWNIGCYITGGKLSANQYYSYLTVSNVSSDSYSIRYLDFYFYIKPNTTNFSLYPTSIEIVSVSSDSLLSSMSSLLASIGNAIAGILEYLPNLAQESTLQTVNSSINSMSSSVVSSINSMSSSVGSKLDSMKTTLNSTISNFNSDMKSAITTMTTTLSNKLQTLLGDNDDTYTDVNNNESAMTDFNSVSNQYDDIESGLVQDFNTNISAIDTDVDLFSVGDFISTSNFISTNLTNIFNSHVYIGYMTMFSLVMGFALVLIGIKVKR